MLARLAKRLEVFRLVAVEEAAVVVEKVDVAPKLAGLAVVNEPEIYKLVAVALVKVELMEFKLETYDVDAKEVVA